MPVVQAVGEAEPAPVGAEPAGHESVQQQEAAVAAEPSAAVAAPVAAGQQQAGGDPEELVKKLFDPLLRRLKIELRLDRERRGRLTDLTH